MRTRQIITVCAISAIIVIGMGSNLRNTSAGLSFCDPIYRSCYELIEYPQDPNPKMIATSIETTPSMQYLESLPCEEILEYEKGKATFSDADVQEFVKEKILACKEITAESQSMHPDTPEIFRHGSTTFVNPDHEHLRYYKTTQVIDDTYLGKSVQQWQDAWDWELKANYEIYKDEFYEKLGGLLVKNEIARVMGQVGIINAQDDFKVHQGISLTSLPPHVGFTAVINATDGNSYLAEASAHSNRVSYYAITQLSFFDTAEELPLADILSYPQTVHVLPEDGNKSRVDPHVLIIHADNDAVNFVNRTPEAIRIQESGTGEIAREHELAWIGPTIAPFESGQVVFDKSGIYEWDARKMPTLENPLWWDSHAGGEIVVLADDVDDLPLEDRLRMGRAILANSEIPVSGMGVGNADHALKISLRSAVYDMLPDAMQYYQDRAEQLVPFDVPIIIKEPEWSNINNED